ncbi:MAG: DEAD/DEAH box helicase, partial [Chloroflexota bacterium]
MKQIPAFLQTLTRFQGITELIPQEQGRIQLSLARAARLPVLAALHHAAGRPILLLTQKSDRALTLVDEFAMWMPKTESLYFPEPPALFYENTPWGDNTRRERLLTLTTLASLQIPGAFKPKTPPIIIAPARAVMTRSLPRRDFLKSTKTLKAGQTYGMTTLARSWMTAGYESATMVVIPGQFAHRGGILDIWPVSEKFPTRLEFFGNEIESLRYFDPASQRTTNTHERLMVAPAREFIAEADNKILPEGDQWSEFYTPLLHPTPASLLDYLPKNCLILFDDREAFEETMDEMETQAVKLRKDYLADGTIADDYPIPYLTLDEIYDSLERYQIIELGPTRAPESGSLAAGFSSNPRFGGKLKELIEYIKQALDQGDNVVVVSRQAARLKDVWEESLFQVEENVPQFVQGSLTDGWRLTPEVGPQVHLLTDGEIFGWQRPQPRKRPRIVPEAPETPYVGFSLNDLAVHIDHGIGRYKGLVKRKFDEVEFEYILMEYAAGDQLYVPVHQVDRLSSYVGAKGHLPRISRLSGADWQSVKSKVKKAVQEVAEDLLELYAKRQVAEGYQFGKDTPWQKELEASFPYIETEDQLRVIEEVKNDMETLRPMDRLICGDVGYGKTEIALRAAFKAVMEGKQVAILVPTTVLAQKHYRTFRQRLAAFPAEVDMLSRFRTPSQQSEILFKLANGALDIVIGTHRL